MPYLQFINQVLRQTSALSRKMYGKVSAKTKRNDVRQVLTAADVAVGKLIIQRIKKNYPDHNIIDEEAGVINKGSKWTWIIDPIDGTANFAQGMPEYGNMIGLLKGDKAYAGGVSLPYFGKIYVAEKGRGTFSDKKRIRIPVEGKLTSKIIVFGFGRVAGEQWILPTGGKLLSKLLQFFPSFRNSGSIYDEVMVLEGRYLGVLNFDGKIWDNVAPQIILEEAGAVYTDWRGQPIDYSNPITKAESNYSWCSAVPAIHKKLQKIIRSL